MSASVSTSMGTSVSAMVQAARRTPRTLATALLATTLGATLAAPAVAACIETSETTGGYKGDAKATPGWSTEHPWTVRCATDGPYVAHAARVPEVGCIYRLTNLPPWVGRPVASERMLPLLLPDYVDELMANYTAQAVTGSLPYPDKPGDVDVFISEADIERLEEELQAAAEWLETVACIKQRPALDTVGIGRDERYQFELRPLLDADGSSLWSEGHYEPDARRIVFNIPFGSMTGTGDAIAIGSGELATVTHEMMHAVIETYLGTGSGPDWFHEGLSEGVAHVREREVRGKVASVGGWAKARYGDHPLVLDYGDGTSAPIDYETGSFWFHTLTELVPIAYLESLLVQGSYLAPYREGELGYGDTVQSWLETTGVKGGLADAFESFVATLATGSAATLETAFGCRGSPDAPFTTIAASNTVIEERISGDSPRPFYKVACAYVAFEPDAKDRLLSLVGDASWEVPPTKASYNDEDVYGRAFGFVDGQRIRLDSGDSYFIPRGEKVVLPFVYFAGMRESYFPGSYAREPVILRLERVSGETCEDEGGADVFICVPYDVGFNRRVSSFDRAASLVPTGLTFEVDKPTETTISGVTPLGGEGSTYEVFLLGGKYDLPNRYAAIGAADQAAIAEGRSPRTVQDVRRTVRELERPPAPGEPSTVFIRYVEGAEVARNVRVELRTKGKVRLTNLFREAMDQSMPGTGPVLDPAHPVLRATDFGGGDGTDSGTPVYIYNMFHSPCGLMYWRGPQGTLGPSKGAGGVTLPKRKSGRYTIEIAHSRPCAIWGDINNPGDAPAYYPRFAGP